MDNLCQLLKMNHQIYCTQYECKIITDNNSKIFDELDRCNVPKTTEKNANRNGVKIKKDHLTSHQKSVYEKRGSGNSVRIKREHSINH